MYVGKNNYQNDELTFKLATGNDWWFHAKGMPGSHVIVKAENKELPDSTFEEAGKLAGYYSKGEKCRQGRDRLSAKKMSKSQTVPQPALSCITQTILSRFTRIYPISGRLSKQIILIS